MKLGSLATKRGKEEENGTSHELQSSQQPTKSECKITIQGLIGMIMSHQQLNLLQGIACYHCCFNLLCKLIRVINNKCRQIDDMWIISLQGLIGMIT